LKDVKKTVYGHHNHTHGKMPQDDRLKHSEASEEEEMEGMDESKIPSISVALPVE
jgi:hypothetical protein